MKSFIEHEILFEDKSRFIKKNKNLTPRQQEIVIDFMKDNEQAVKRNRKTKIDWNKSTDITWERWLDIFDLIGNSPSAMKAKARKLRHKGVSGLKEGEDYVYVKTKNKAFLCYIPLNAKANQVIFSSNIGGVHHTGCIGSSHAQSHYKSEAVKKGLVPVVVIGASKDTVMVRRDNKQWELWDACNNKYSNGSAPHVNKELIPNFNIKRELMTNKLAGLYDWVRSEIWGKPIGTGNYDQDEYEEAVEAYENLAIDIERYAEEYRGAEEYGNDQVHKIINDTIEKYREEADERIDDYETEYNKAKTGMEKSDTLASKRVMDRVKAIRTAVELRPNGTDVNADGEPVWHISGVEQGAVNKKFGGKSMYQRGRGNDRKEDISRMDLSGSNLIPYTKAEIDSFLDYAEKNYVKTPEEDIAIDNQEWEEAEAEARAEAQELMDVVDNLEKLLSDGDWYEVYDDQRSGGKDWLDDVDWTDDIPSNEYDWTDEVYSPYLQSDEYAPYFNFNEQHGNGDSIDGDYGLEESIRETPHEGGNNVDGSQVLADNDYVHPDQIVANMTSNEED